MIRLALRPTLALHLALTAVLLGGGLAPASAQGSGGAPDAAPPDAWEFSIQPYLWGAGIDGTLTTERLEVDVDVSFSDIFEALDVGVLGTFEARRGRLSLASNLVYLKGSTDASRPVGRILPIAPPGSFEADVVSQTLIVEGLAGWEVLSVPLSDASDERRVALDLRGGFRVWWLDNEVDVKLRPGLPIGPFSRSFDESTDWIDFVLGARARATVTDRLTLVATGDYGGFDVGSSSHRTWSIAGLVLYRITEHWDLGLGWRTIDIERDVADVTMQGPLVGGRYRF
jgi:hypothetical protein